MKRIFALLMSAGLVAAGWGLADRKTTRTKITPQAPVILALAPNAVAQLVLQSEDGQRTVLRQASEGVWLPDGGTAGQAATLMTEYQDAIFPLRGYKKLNADRNDAQYGLVDPGIRLRVQDANGGWHDLAIGTVTFNGGGSYVERVDQGGVLYLVPRGTVDQLRSLLAGEPVVSPRTAREAEVQAEMDKQADAYKRIGAGEPVPPAEEDPWLRQALEAGGDANGVPPPTTSQGPDPTTPAGAKPGVATPGAGDGDALNPSPDGAGEARRDTARTRS